MLQMRASAAYGCAVTLQALLDASDPASYPAASKTWRWALAAGAFPPPAERGDREFADVLLTGHDDGSVSFWDVGAEVPRRLLVTEARHAARKVVSAIAMDADAGLMAVGLFGGEVRAARAFVALAISYLTRIWSCPRRCSACAELYVLAPCCKSARCAHFVHLVASSAHTAAALVQISVMQWCDERRDVTCFSLPCSAEELCDGARPSTMGSAEPPGWQLVLRIPGKPSSPSGVRCAVTSLEWLVQGLVSMGQGGPGEALLAFAHADGSVGMVNLAPGGEAPEVLWCHEVNKDPAGELPRPCDPGADPAHVPCRAARVQNNRVLHPLVTQSLCGARHVDRHVSQSCMLRPPV
jgi:hypothetical protein